MISFADLILLLQDLAQNAAAVCLVVACAAAAGAAAGLTASPAHRNRYRALDEDAGDTHTNWGLHRVPAEVLTRTPTAARPRVRAITGSVLAASQSKLRPSFDSRLRGTCQRDGDAVA